MAQSVAQARRMRLRRLVADAGSVNSVAARAEIREGTLRAYFKNSTRELTLTNYEKLAAVLGVEPAWLVFGVEKEALTERERKFVALASKVSDLYLEFALKGMEREAAENELKGASRAVR